MINFREFRQLQEATLEEATNPDNDKFNYDAWVKSAKPFRKPGKAVKELAKQTRENNKPVKESQDLDFDKSTLSHDNLNNTNEHIVKVGSEYELKSKKSGKNLGKYPTKEGAEKRERQVEYFKHVNEAVDKKDTVTMDIPLLIRVLELAREDIKSDVNLHKVVEKLISIRNKGALTMDDYNTISHIKECVEQLDELEKSTLANYVRKAHQASMDVATGNSFRSGARGDKYNKAQDSQRDKMRNKGINRALGKLSEQEVPHVERIQKWVI